jgi:hypothetical protein
MNTWGLPGSHIDSHGGVAMSDTMTAVRNYAPRDYRLEQIERPHAGQNEVVI